MKKLMSFIGAITGSYARHNRALDELKEMVTALQEFINKCGEPDVFEDIGPARMEVTSLMHQLRTRFRVFKYIKAKNLRRMLHAVYDNLESVRVDIYNTSKGRFDLTESLSRLNDSVKTMAETISEIEYK